MSYTVRERTVATPERRTRRRIGVALMGLALMLAACAGRPAQPLPPAPTATAVPTPVNAAAPWLKQPPEPLVLPRDEAPHDVLTEWWYYTGHLDTTAGERYGFEFVIFQVGLGGGPSYISHLAITDATRQTFTYDQRTQLGRQPGAAGGGFALQVGDWSMQGRDGQDRLAASLPSYGLNLQLRAVKPAAIHLGTGYISFGPAGDSYYYSRTRMEVTGTLVDHGTPKAVTGTAWFDKQWGDFLSVKGGGWDWYALQLDDGAEIMLFDVRDPTGKPAIIYGSYIAADGALRDLPPGAFSIEATQLWRSPRSGAEYPAAWRIRVPDLQLDVTVTPILPDQELDTRATTGVIYWEGAVGIRGQRAGVPVAGRGYVELTGYAR